MREWVNNVFIEFLMWILYYVKYVIIANCTSLSWLSTRSSSLYSRRLTEVIRSIFCTTRRSVWDRNAEDNPWFDGLTFFILFDSDKKKFNSSKNQGLPSSSTTHDLRVVQKVDRMTIRWSVKLSVSSKVSPHPVPETRAAKKLAR